LEINIAEAQSHLSQILSQVEQGEEVIIIREGKAIARLSPIYKNLQPLT
jgi:prevent-host-death family protein